MLHGLSVIDGSLERSVTWRRRWWRASGVTLCAVAGTLVALSTHGLGGPRTQLAPALLCLAVAAFLEGGRILEGSRKTRRSLRLHRIALGFALAGVIWVSGPAGLLCLPPAAWEALRHGRAGAPPRDASDSPGRLGPRASP